MGSTLAPPFRSDTDATACSPEAYVEAMLLFFLYQAVSRVEIPQAYRQS